MEIQNNSIDNGSNNQELQQLRILHLEDNSFDAEIIRKTLENEGVNCLVKRIETKELFIQELQHHTYDMIFSDYMMPSFTALDALKIIQDKNDSTPFLIISGAIGEETAIDAIKLGATDYVLKNRLVRLVPALRRIIEDREKKLALSVAERNVAGSHAELAALVSSAIDGVMSITPQGRIRIINESAKKLFRYSTEELYQLNIAKVIPEILTKLNEEESNQLRLTGIRKDGSKIELEISLSVYIMNGARNYMIVLRDVTDRILLENSLLDSQEHAQLGSWVFDIKSKELKWSDETFRIFDLPVHSPIPSFDKYLSLIYELDRDAIKKLIRSAITLQQPYYVDHRIITEKSAMKWVQSKGKLLFDSDGNSSHLQGTIQDITHRKAYEEELENRNREMDTFVYRISHDLRSPICSIQGIINMCQLDTDKTNQAQYLKLINSSIEKLFLFISQTLSHSKNLNMPIQKAKVYFESLIKEVFDSYQQSSGWSEINLSLRVSDDEYYGDPERIKVIFNSLISNSVKFFDPQKAEKRVEIEVSHEDAFIKIVFADNGIGIPESVLPKIFDMFYRGNESSTGSGLGLYILKQYVDKMKGSVHVKSNLSEGSHFEIMIPKLARE